MPLVSMRQLLDHAAENNYGIPAFNVNNMEQVRAIMRAAHDTDSPVILQASAGARDYAGEAFLRHQILAALESYPHVPIVMHQDHGQSPAVCVMAIRSGFTSVMMDGSLLEDGKTPANYDHNVRVTAQVTAIAHAVGVSVEGELGVLGSLESGKAGKEDGHGAEGVMGRERLLTDPEEAARFVQATQVDALAIAIGTSHGAYKFSRKPTGDILAIDRVKEIHARLPNTHLVMHGSSSVPQDLLAIINSFGGTIPETYGVPVEEICTGIRYGVRKINIDTDLRLAMTAAIRQQLANNAKNFDPRKYLRPAEDAAYRICKERFEQFGTAGNAPRIHPISMEEMAMRYESGQLTPQVQS
ncbi:MAG: fructose-bisphosphate aldolase class II [Magnetococcales bacterium]|nr:fructose-bisphosphate aldolase class II [Magnetococcales bacterium]MBF0584927.1 fructose-bisphosphate aldolase class II [Magnetococcales bacterium]